LRSIHTLHGHHSDVVGDDVDVTDGGGEKAGDGLCGSKHHRSGFTLEAVAPARDGALRKRATAARPSPVVPRRERRSRPSVAGGSDLRPEPRSASATRGGRGSARSRARSPATAEAPSPPAPDRHRRGGPPAAREWPATASGSSGHASAEARGRGSPAAVRQPGAPPKGTTVEVGMEHRQRLLRSVPPTDGTASWLR